MSRRPPQRDPLKPLDDLDDVLDPAPGPVPRPDRAPSGESRSAQAGKRHMGFKLPADLGEELRDAVVALQGHGVSTTLNAVAERALRAELARLYTEHNQGKPFPHRSAPPRTGRPIGG